MPNQVDASLKLAFQKARKVEDFLSQHFPITCDVPDSREPEFGMLFDRIETAHQVQEHILSHPLIREIGNPKPHDGLIVSLPQDTVDKDGMPTELMKQFGLESRRRFNYVPKTRKTSRYDVSFKSAGKNTDRKEWEEDSTGFDNGLKAAARKVARDNPDINIMSISPSAYCTLGVCMAARSSSYILQMLPDESACIKWEINTDPCAISTPHADILLGYRKEQEPEIQEIYFPKNGTISEKRTGDLLDPSIRELKSIILSGHFSEEIYFAEESKGAQTARMASEYYAENSPYGDTHTGTEIALLQNVRAKTFLGKTNKLFLLAQTIPSSATVSQATINTSYDQYFPTRTDSPKNTTRELKIAGIGGN